VLPDASGILWTSHTQAGCLVKGGKKDPHLAKNQWCLTSANRGTSDTWAHAEQAQEHLGLRDSPSDRLGFEASGRISSSPTRATESSKSAAPSQAWRQILLKHAGDELRPYGRGCPCGRCGRVLNISRRGAGLKSHADDKQANPATRPCLTAPKWLWESRGQGIARRQVASWDRLRSY
jgi:hypothetical protein